ncbi:MULTISPECIES: carboxyltransferase domain-containing protein [unclassified Corynebacterium]|uniref:5-oxoprolinase subunit B/C family protein n=1 Tax=unclassified Corynebacterium TaxID=2624378 RepID=UPI0029CA1BF6|nr:MULTISPECIES: carboxyltransferase domain-containing protein [unclassified Corynebacterium]WPF66824.1 carboxyltransferase domain-containing protein [Corynebacterium sp. 22KM0430]WPF69312.1 carboxyltransferase domain-containing protein [Corynebacterium sp. 21KM1197]
MSTTIHRVGTRALLVEVGELDLALRWHAHLSKHPVPGQVELIAAAATVLVVTDSPRHAHQAARLLAGVEPERAATEAPREVEVEVIYDGPDLTDTADLLGMSTEELISWHTETPWRAAFGGFAPGFTYCVPSDPARARRVPRLDSPRTQVPHGAVGLADTFSAVYPRTSPGGWRLLGHSPTPMWDSAATPPAAIRPGDTVRYRAVRESVEVSATTNAAAAANTAAEASISGIHQPALRLDDPGLLSLIQDQGRGGHGDLGVTGSGAADRASAYAANSAVGNPTGSAVIENIGGLRLTTLIESTVAVTGAQAEITINGRPVPLGTPRLLPAGATLSIGPASAGQRSYLAVRGGLAAPQVLGSRSADVLSGLGPAPLEAGQTLRVHPHRGGQAARPTANPLRVRPGEVAVLRCVPGPRDRWFAGEFSALTEQEWTVTPRSNRVGLRLDGTPLRRTHEGELPSEGVVAGCIQVPPQGTPVVFLRDHPVTGGYPVIATVIPEDLDLAAQLPAGATVRFEEYEEYKEEHDHE